MACLPLYDVHLHVARGDWPTVTFAGVWLLVFGLPALLGRMPGAHAAAVPTWMRWMNAADPGADDAD